MTGKMKQQMEKEKEDFLIMTEGYVNYRRKCRDRDIEPKRQDEWQEEADFFKQVNANMLARELRDQDDNL